MKVLLLCLLSRVLLYLHEMCRIPRRQKICWILHNHCMPWRYIFDSDWQYCRTCSTGCTKCSTEGKCLTCNETPNFFFLTSRTSVDVKRVSFWNTMIIGIVKSAKKTVCTEIGQANFQNARKVISYHPTKNVYNAKQ